mgnify:CR=1 FL=1
MFYSSKLAKKEIHLATETEITSAEEQSKAILLLKNADNKRYKDLKDDLKMVTYLSMDEYPTTIASMYELMVKTYGGLDPRSTNRSRNSNTNQSYVNTRTILTQHKVKNPGDADETKIVPGKDGVTHDVMCYNCKRRGHYALSCPELFCTIPDSKTKPTGVHQHRLCASQYMLNRQRMQKHQHAKQRKEL